MDVFSFLPSFGSRKPKRGARNHQAKPGKRATLRLESLEDRLVMDASVISGFVYADTNNNGLFDPGEKPIANSSIQLKNSSGMVIGQTVTDVNGFYKFTTDNTIDTTPAILAKSATIPTTSTDWNQTVTVGQFDPSLGTLTSIDIINAGTFTSSIKVESLDGGPSTIVATISGTITLNGTGFSALVSNISSSKTFNASAFDGVIDFGGTSGHDFGSPSSSGSNTVTLSDPASLAAYIGTGTISLSDGAHATSSASGAGNLLTQIGTTANAQISVVYHYIPSNAIKPGNYTIVQTQEPPGYLDGKESSGGVVIPNSIGTDSIPVVFNGSTSTDNDFGELLPASLSGTVYVDTNNNGIKETGEAGIAGVTIKLTGTSDIGPVSLTTTTAADGTYSFTNLRPGTYNIQETQPNGYLDGIDTLGSLSGTLSNDLFSAIGVPNGASGINYNFGELPAAGLSGNVYVDSNDNGIKDAGETGIGGVTVNLTGASDIGPVSLTTTTAADGSYSFNNLRPGTYSIQEVQPSGYLDGKDTLGSLSGTAANDLFSAIAVANGAKGINYNFGELLASSLAGKVYVDANINGALDPGETGIGSVTLKLTGTDDLGNPVNLTTTTAADGSYKFNNLRPGSYQIVETQPAGYLDGKTTAGSVGGLAGVNQISAISLPSGNNAVSYNFGEVVPTGSLSGRVYYDQNGNGVMDPGEIGLQTTITLTGVDDQNHPVNLTTTTDANGNYAFGGLRPGVYAITETQPSPYVDGAMNLGSLGGQIGNNQFLGIQLSAGQAGVQYNFGELLLKSSTNKFQPTILNLDFLSKLGVLSNSQQIIAQATQIAYYVDGVYTITLGRHADANGLSYFTFGLLRGDFTRQTFVSILMSTTEHFSSVVNASFLSILGRNADPGALSYYSGLMAQGVSIENINASLLASNEFQVNHSSNSAYIQGVFLAALGRPANAGDLGFWQAQLAAGQSRMAVALAVVHSTEGIGNEINQDYLNVLGRAADAGSLNQWVSMIQSGQTTEPQVVAMMLGSAEFNTRVLVAAKLI